MSQKVLIGIVVVLVAFIAGFFGWRYFQFTHTTSLGLPSISLPKAKEKLVTSTLDGTQVPESAAARRPLAVSIENHPEARPQVGLDNASIVYEAIAEGGITRFLAIFGPTLPDKLGPVRSARTFFVNWAADWDAMLAHVGGSKDGLELLKSSGVADLDQFALGARAYEREPRNGIAIEHTMFGFPQKLYEAAQNFSHFNTTEQKFTPWVFKQELAVTERGAGQTVSVDFSQPEYKVIWTYDPTTNTYLRAQNGAPHKDGVSGKQLAVKNLVLMTVNRHQKTFEDAKAVFEFDLTGTGKATVFQDGKQIDATWKRAAFGTRATYLDAQGGEIKMNPGHSWIEIVNPDAVKTEIKPLVSATTTVPAATTPATPAVKPKK